MFEARLLKKKWKRAFLFLVFSHCILMINGRFICAMNKERLSAIMIESAIMEGQQVRDTVILLNNGVFKNQLNRENAVYFVRDTFDLEGGKVVLPKNCVLKMDGGFLLNGTIVGQNSLIEGENYSLATGSYRYRGYSKTADPYVNSAYDYVESISGPELRVEGTWDNASVNPKLVGLDIINTQECSRNKLQKFISLHRKGITISVPRQKYYYYGRLFLDNNSIDFNGSTLIVNKYSDIYDASLTLPASAYQLPKEDVSGLEMCWGLLSLSYNGLYDSRVIRNVIIDGNRDNNVEQLRKGVSCLVQLGNSKRTKFENVTFQNSPSNCVYGMKTTEVEFEDCVFQHCSEHGVYSNICVGFLSFTRCSFINCGDSQEMIDFRNGASYAIKCFGWERYPEEIGESRIVLNDCIVRNNTNNTRRAFFDGACSHLIMNNTVFDSNLLSSWIDNRKTTSGETVVEFHNCTNGVYFARTYNTTVSLYDCEGTFILNDEVKNVHRCMIDVVLGSAKQTAYYREGSTLNTDLRLDHSEIRFLSGNQYSSPFFTTSKAIVFSHCKIQCDRRNAKSGTMEIFRINNPNGSGVNLLFSDCEIDLEDKVITRSATGELEITRSKVFSDRGTNMEAIAPKLIKTKIKGTSFQKTSL